MMTYASDARALFKGCGSMLELMPTQARLTAVNSIVEGMAMAVVSATSVQLNPPVVPPRLPVLQVPQYLPGELGSSWGTRKRPEPTPRFESDQDPPPGGA
jgi:hypothetical protein